MDEIRRLKSLLVKHEKRIRALEAKTSANPESPASANSSLLNASTSSPTGSPREPATNNSSAGENHVTHDTNANVAKLAATTEDMAPDEVWSHEAAHSTHKPPRGRTRPFENPSPPFQN